MTRTTKNETWAVTVERNGEHVVTLASNHHSWRDLSVEDARVIRNAARHLLAFLGRSELFDADDAVAGNSRVTTG